MNFGALIKMFDTFMALTDVARRVKGPSGPARDGSLTVLYPGLFQQFDTSTGDISTTLAKNT